MKVKKILKVWSDVVSHVINSSVLCELFSAMAENLGRKVTALSTGVENIAFMTKSMS